MVTIFFVINKNYSSYLHPLCRHFRGIDTIFQGVLIPPRQGVIATTSRVSLLNQQLTQVLYITENQHKTNNTPSQHPINTHNLIKKAVNSRRFLVIELKHFKYERKQRIDGNKPGINKFK